MKSNEKTILHLPSGTHFPFVAGLENWFEIEKFITITAYCSDSHIFTIMTIPLITYPGYDIINIIPLPTHSHDNIHDDGHHLHNHSGTTRRERIHDHNLRRDSKMQTKRQHICIPSKPFHIQNQPRCGVRNTNVQLKNTATK